MSRFCDRPRMRGRHAREGLVYKLYQENMLKQITNNQPENMLKTENN